MSTFSSVLFVEHQCPLCSSNIKYLSLIIYVCIYIRTYLCMYVLLPGLVCKEISNYFTVYARSAKFAEELKMGWGSDEREAWSIIWERKTAQFSHLHWNRRWGRSHCFISQSERDTAIVCKWKGACVIVIVFITRRATECEMLVLSLPRWMAQRNEKSDKTRKQIESTKAEYSARNRNW